MAVAHTATGSRATTGTTTQNIGYPSGVAAGRLAIACRTIKPDTATGAAESGWEQRVSATGGTGTIGNDVGQTRIVVDTRELVGTESGNVQFDQGSSPNSVTGVMLVYQNATSAWALATASGSDATHGTGRSVTASSSIALAPGDVVLAICASDTDATTAFATPAITAAGIVFGVTTGRLGAGGASTGNDCGLMVYEATVATGSATAAPSLTLTLGPSNCGPVAFVRLREGIAGTAVASLGGLTATAVGTRTVSGTAVASLGGLSATAVGQRTVIGSAAGSLGGLTATAVGQRTVIGSGAASLGGLTAGASGTPTSPAVAGGSFVQPLIDSTRRTSGRLLIPLEISAELLDAELDRELIVPALVAAAGEVETFARLELDTAAEGVPLEVTADAVATVLPVFDALPIAVGGDLTAAQLTLYME